MAKRKTPKVKDLGPKKITDEQLKEIQSVVRAIQAAQTDLGSIETQKHNILHEIMQLQNMANSVQEKLKEEYGDVDISIADGTIKEKVDEQANS
jgi:peptidoglycan hydrolase CwlO-like protein|tara:strand:+ start:1047 stop:1328 length:282 start_codon:yes stop_codon:yes gene_type:complete